MLTRITRFLENLTPISMILGVTLGVFVGMYGGFIVAHMATYREIYNPHSLFMNPVYAILFDFVAMFVAGGIISLLTQVGYYDESAQTLTKVFVQVGAITPTLAVGSVCGQVAGIFFGCVVFATIFLGFNFGFTCGWILTHRQSARARLSA